MNFTSERPLPLTNTSKPSVEGDFLASWLVMLIFHTKLSAGRRKRSASRTMSAASSAAAGATTASIRTRPSVDLNMPQRLDDVQAGRAPRRGERGQGRRDQREAEGLHQHLGHDEDLHGEATGGAGRRRGLGAD